MHALGGLWRSLAVTGAAITTLCALAVSASALAGQAKPIVDPVPIGPDEHFVALVNGHAGRSVIKVVCAGPAVTGHPMPGQRVKVVLAGPHPSPRDGFTGRAGRRVLVWLHWRTPVVAGLPIRVAVLTSYGVAAKISTHIEVPCAGTGRLAFVPAPGSRSARTAVVRVAFKNLGV